MKAATRRSSKRPPAFVAPYPPGGVDRFTAWVARVPAGPWAFYLGGGLLLFVLATGVHWAAGTYPVGHLSRQHAIGAFLAPYAIGLIDYLDRSAALAMKSFAPALRGGGDSYQRLTYILTTFPPRFALVGGLAGLAAGLMLVLGAALLVPLPADVAGSGSGRDLLALLSLGFAALFEIGRTPASYVATIAFLTLNWWAGGILALHTIRRLFLVARIYARHTEVNLFKQGPLYALSRLTAQTTIGAVLVVYAIASVPSYMTQPVGGITVALIALLAAASFLLPLLRVHSILGSEKERLLDGIANRLHNAGEELHRRIDLGTYRGMDERHKALAGLEIERNMIASMPTWPWQPETLRWVLAAMILPVLIWVIQLLLQRALTP